MNYPNNDFNQNNYWTQENPNHNYEIPIFSRNDRNNIPRELGDNKYNNIPNKTMQGFYINKNINVVENKYSKESKPISRNTNTLGRTKTDPLIQFYKFSKSPNSQIHQNNNYTKYTNNPKKIFIDENQKRRRPIYYEYSPSKLKMRNFVKKKNSDENKSSKLNMRNFVIKKNYDELKKNIVKEIINEKKNKTYDDFQEMVVNYGYLNKKVLEEEVKKILRILLKSKKQ